MEGRLVDVQVDVGRGLPGFTVVGGASPVVREGRDRVRSALRNAGFAFPAARVTVNLAPAGLPKGGTHFDLAMALGLLLASGQLRPPAGGWEETLVLGELALDGRVLPVHGALPMALAARARGFRRALVAPGNAAELELLPDWEVRTLERLAQLASPGPAPVAKQAWASGGSRPRARGEEAGGRPVLLEEIVGQAAAKKALELVAAGGHHLLLSGPPGVGKSMLGQALPALLPPLEGEERLERAAVASAAGLGLALERPFRAPHHSATLAAVIGGGAALRPGEATLAHTGILFLDEAGEFAPEVLEALREPLESGEIRLARSWGTVRLPARFTLVATRNLCPCGRRGAPGQFCQCRPWEVQRYEARLSGPLLDRIDLHVRVEGEPVREFRPARTAEVLERVARARELQRRRGGPENGRLEGALLRELAPLEAEAERTLERLRAAGFLSLRSRDRLHRVARTLADLEGRERIEAGDVALAAQLCRPLRLEPPAGGEAGFRPA